MLITIDWDFFFDNKWHFEANSYTIGNIIWSIRDGDYHAKNGKFLHEVYLPDQKLLCQLTDIIHANGISDIDAVSITQDHHSCFDLANEGDHKHIVSFDYHWDIAYTRKLKSRFTHDDVRNENWLGYWLKQDKSRTATIFLSPFSSELDRNEPAMLELIPKSLYDRIEVRAFDPNYTPEKFRNLHICLSPEWVPPWCDNDFWDFVNLFTNRQFDYQTRGYNKEDAVKHSEATKMAWNIFEGESKCQ